MEALKLRCIVAARETLLEENRIEYDKIDKLQASKMVQDRFGDVKEEQPQIAIPELPKPISPKTKAKRRSSIGLTKPSTPQRLQPVATDNAVDASICVVEEEPAVNQSKPEPEPVKESKRDSNLFKPPSTTVVPKKRRSRSDFAEMSIEVNDETLLMEGSISLMETTADRFPDVDFNATTELKNRSSNIVEIVPKVTDESSSESVIMLEDTLPLDDTINIMPVSTKGEEPTKMSRVGSGSESNKENQIGNTVPGSRKISSLPVPTGSTISSAGARPLYAPKGRPVVRTIKIMPKKKEADSTN